MKRHLLLFIALLAIATGAKADVTINSTNFPDENFRNYLLSQDYGWDGVITSAEIMTIKTILVSNKGIKSLKGIEHFTALTGLNCSDNQLTQLDVSKNMELVGLNCDYNNLGTLNVSQNTKLTELRCYKNGLTALDVSKNTALIQLYCSYNKITKLDVSNNKELFYLYCDGNGLTSLDVSKNTALNSLSCSENQLTAIDVSNNTALESLDCNDNLLTTLDVSKNPMLYNLGCYHNQIKGDKMDHLIASLPINYTTTEHTIPVIDDSSAEGNVITTEQVLAIYARGWSPRHLEGRWWLYYEVNIPINEENFPDDIFRKYLLAQNYGQDGVLTKDEILSLNTQMWLVDVDEEGIASLKGIEYFIALNDLQCGYNQLTALDVSKNTRLTELGCSANRISVLDVSKNTLLETLYCDDNLLTTLDVSSNRSLGTLCCYGNHIKGTAMDDLIASLPQKFGIVCKFIVVSNRKDEGNVCTKQQVQAAKARGWTPYCYDDNTGEYEPYDGSDPVPEGLLINEENFPDAIFRNFLLASYYGEDGVFTDDEIMNITDLNFLNMGITTLKGIEYFTELQLLRCNYTQLTVLDVSKNTKLTQLDCSMNQLTALDVSNNRSLTDLWCHNNQLTALDVSNCRKLKTLSCENNQIKGTAMDNLIASLPENSTKNKVFYVISNGEDEGNVCTKQQVQAAKHRGWTPYYYNDISEEYEPYEGPEPKTGDVNGDGAVDVADIATIIDVMAGSGMQYRERADVNNDQTVDVADIASVIDMMASSSRMAGKNE